MARNENRLYLLNGAFDGDGYYLHSHAQANFGYANAQVGADLAPLQIFQTEEDIMDCNIPSCSSRQELFDDV